jgi:hypothetical protein
MESSSSNKNVPTTAGLVNCKPSKMVCVFCLGSHSSYACFKAQKMNNEEKRDIANRKGFVLHVLRLGTLREDAEPS